MRKVLSFIAGFQKLLNSHERAVQSWAITTSASQSDRTCKYYTACFHSWKTVSRTREKEGAFLYTVEFILRNSFIIFPVNANHGFLCVCFFFHLKVVQLALYAFTKTNIQTKKQTVNDWSTTNRRRSMSEQQKAIIQVSVSGFALYSSEQELEKISLRQIS